MMEKWLRPLQQLRLVIPTTYVFLYPCECDAPFFTALAKAQQEGPRRFWTKQCPLSLLADKSHNIPVKEQQGI